MATVKIQKNIGLIILKDYLNVIRVIMLVNHLKILLEMII